MVERCFSCLVLSPLSLQHLRLLLFFLRTTARRSVDLSPVSSSASSSWCRGCLLLRDARAFLLTFLILVFSLFFSATLTVSSSFSSSSVLSSFDSIASPQVFSSSPVSPSSFSRFSSSSSFSSLSSPPRQFVSLPSFSSSAVHHLHRRFSSSFSRPRETSSHPEGEIRDKFDFHAPLHISNLRTLHPRCSSSSSFFLPPRFAFLILFSRHSGASCLVFRSSINSEACRSSRANHSGVHTPPNAFSSYPPTTASRRTDFLASFNPLSSPPLCSSPQLSSSFSFFPRNLLFSISPPSYSSENIPLKASLSHLSSSLSSSSSPPLASTNSLSSSSSSVFRDGHQLLRGALFLASCLPFSSSLFTREFLFSPSLCEPATRVHALHRRVQLLKFLQKQREGLRASRLLGGFFTFTSVCLAGFLLSRGLHWLSDFFAKQHRLVRLSKKQQKSPRFARLNSRLSRGALVELFFLLARRLFSPFRLSFFLPGCALF